MTRGTVYTYRESYYEIILDTIGEDLSYWVLSFDLSYCSLSTDDVHDFMDQHRTLKTRIFEGEL